MGQSSHYKYINRLDSEKLLISPYVGQWEVILGLHITFSLWGIKSQEDCSPALKKIRFMCENKFFYFLTLDNSQSKTVTCKRRKTNEVIITLSPSYCLEAALEPQGRRNLRKLPRASQVAQVLKNPPAYSGDSGDMGSIPGSGRSPGGGNGNPLQYSCLEDSMDREAWWATVQGVAKSQTRLSNWALRQKDAQGLSPAAEEFKRAGAARILQVGYQEGASCRERASKIWREGLLRFCRMLINTPHHHGNILLRKLSETKSD